MIFPAQIILTPRSLRFVPDNNADHILIPGRKKIKFKNLDFILNMKKNMFFFFFACLRKEERQHDSKTKHKI